MWLTRREAKDEERVARLNHRVLVGRNSEAYCTGSEFIMVDYGWRLIQFEGWYL
jgi:hypothetical protein